MATNLIKFEAYIDETDFINNNVAVQAFINSLLAIGVEIVEFSANNYTTQVNTVAFYGLVNATQQAPALTALNTLNTALGHNILCFVTAVTTEP